MADEHRDMLLSARQIADRRGDDAEAGVESYTTKAILSGRRTGLLPVACRGPICRRVSRTPAGPVLALDHETHNHRLDTQDRHRDTR
jgi:hypothetical protein